MNKQLNGKTVVLVLLAALVVIGGAIYLATEPKHGGAPTGPDFSKGVKPSKSPANGAGKTSASDTAKKEDSKK